MEQQAKSHLRTEISKYENTTDADWEYISERFSFKELRKGEHYLQVNSICNRLAFVTDGLLRTYTINSEGNEITTHFAYPDSFDVAYTSFKNRTPSYEGIQAVDDTCLLEIGYQQLQDLFMNLPAWYRIHSGIIESAYECMLNRNYILQNYSAQEKYDELIEKGHPAIIQKAQLTHISSYLGIKLETLSRIRKQFSRSNI